MSGRPRSSLLKQEAQTLDKQRMLEKMLRAGLLLPESLEAVAREWFYKQEGAWAKGHREKIVRRLERDVFPWLGARPIVSIKPADVLQVAATALRSVASFKLPCPRLPLTRAWHGHGHGRAACQFPWWI